MKNERPLPVVGTQLPQCRVRRSQWSQGFTPRLPPAMIYRHSAISIIASIEANGLDCTISYQTCSSKTGAQICDGKVYGRPGESTQLTPLGSSRDVSRSTSDDINIIGGPASECTSVPMGLALNFLQHTEGASGSPANTTWMGFEMKAFSAVREGVSE